METKEFVMQWLREHQGFQQEEVSKEDMAHFVAILTDICDAIKQKTIKEFHKCMKDRENSTLDCIRFKPKSKFPMTWEEAYEMSDKYDYIDERGKVQSVSVLEYISDDDRFFIPSGMGTSMLALCQLLVLRNAWWKADGDWRPDWKDGQAKHYIATYKGQIDKDSVTYCNEILVFRTPEIRDKFYEAFKDLIEKAKELL